MNNCVPCTRWKLFDEKPCAAHPELKTDREKHEDVEREQWRQANENLQVLTFTAGLRTTAALGREDMYLNILANLMRQSESVQLKVAEELERLGPMTTAEVTDSVLMGLAIQRNNPDEKMRGGGA